MSQFKKVSFIMTMSKKFCPFKLVYTLDWLMNFLYAYAIISLIFPLSTHHPTFIQSSIYLNKVLTHHLFFPIHSETLLVWVPAAW